MERPPSRNKHHLPLGGLQRLHSHAWSDSIEGLSAGHLGKRDQGGKGTVRMEDQVTNELLYSSGSAPTVPAAALDGEVVPSVGSTGVTRYATSCGGSVPS